MTELQYCIELISTMIVEIMEDALPDALRAHPAPELDLEATGVDIAALARTVGLLRRRQASGG